MSRNRYYQHLLNQKRWKELRLWKLQRNPLCERCIEEGEAQGIEGGYIKAAIDVHHIVPVETGKTEQQMEQLCYDPNNLRSLCVPCHVKTHKEMGKNTKANHKERTQTRLQQWIARHQRPERDDAEGNREPGA